MTISTSAVPAKIHPMGLPGCCRATTMPTTAYTSRAARPAPSSETAKLPVRNDKETPMAARASTTAPSTVAVIGDTSAKRRPVTAVAPGRPAAGCACPHKADATPGPFRKRYRAARFPAPGRNRKITMPLQASN